MTVTPSSSDARHEAILRAALEVFLACGVPGASIEEIRRRSGASTGSLYHRFAGKEAIAAAVYLDALAAYQQAFLETLREPGGTEATVKAIVCMHLRWVGDHPDRAEFLMSGLDATIRRGAEEPLRELNRAFFARVLAWLTPRSERGSFSRRRSRSFTRCGSDRVRSSPGTGSRGTGDARRSTTRPACWPTPRGAL